MHYKEEVERPATGGDLGHVDGVLLDIDGVLTVSWRPIAGAPETLAWLRREAIPFRLITNTTTISRTRLAGVLREAGFGVEREEILSAASATGAYLRAHHPGARCFVLGETVDLAEDLEGIDLVGEGADVVVVAGADDDFTWAHMNRALGMLLDGAELVAMQRNLTWLTDEGLKFDAGPYVAGLELASGKRAALVGKPDPGFFHQGLEALDLPAERVAMVGDDLAFDVLAAQALGLTGVLVRTGKFLPEVDHRREQEPDVVVSSIAELPRLLGTRA